MIRGIHVVFRRLANSVFASLPGKVLPLSGLLPDGSKKLGKCLPARNLPVFHDVFIASHPHLTSSTEGFEGRLSEGGGERGEWQNFNRNGRQRDELKQTWELTKHAEKRTYFSNSSSLKATGERNFCSNKKWLC